jgi:hypothetical protein
MVSVVQQEFYKGYAPSLHSRRLQCFDTEWQVFSYRSSEKEHQPPPQAPSRLLRLYVASSFCTLYLFLCEILSLAPRLLFALTKQGVTSR